MKNLLLIHLESVSRERLAAFGGAFPNLRALLARAVVFDSYFSSATSTLMVVSYLAHGNDFEFDIAREFEGMRPARNLPHLFEVLHGRGYDVGVLCLNAYQGERPSELSSWPDTLPPVWGTNDFPELFARFDAATDARPFALYVWNLITHVEHSLALAPHAEGLTDQLWKACALADDAIGRFVATLERKGRLDDTTIVLYGDHGDDFWTHGFKTGMVHGTEPYTGMTWAPLAIVDPTLAPGTHSGLAATVDIRATCLALLGIDDGGDFGPAGVDLFAAGNDVVFAQNFTASQPDSAALRIKGAFAATDHAYTLLASSHGLELYAYRLDPGNHCNLLHFFELAADGRLVPAIPPGGAAHFRRALADNPRALDHVAAGFHRLRDGLAGRLAAKREYIAGRGGVPAAGLDPRCLATINRDGRGAFFGQGAAPHAPAFEFSFKLP
jgi:hypothetical protein